VAAKGSPAGTDFLLNGLLWRICAFGGAGYDNLIQPVVNIARRYQIPHGRFRGFVPHPVLSALRFRHTIAEGKIGYLSLTDSRSGP